MVPLRSVAEPRLIVGPQTIIRYNNKRSVTLNGGPAPGRSSGEALAAMEKLSDATLPRGYSYEWTGTALQEKEAAGQTAIILGLAVLFAYLFLVALYESWTIPVPVLLSVSVGLLGAHGGLVGRRARQQHLRPDRHRRADRARRQERHPDHRVRQGTARARRQHHRRRGRRRPRPVPRGDDDQLRLHRRPLSRWWWPTVRRC